MLEETEQKEGVGHQKWRASGPSMHVVVISFFIFSPDLDNK